MEPLIESILNKTKLKGNIQADIHLQDIIKINTRLNPDPGLDGTYVNGKYEVNLYTDGYYILDQDALNNISKITCKHGSSADSRSNRVMIELDGNRFNFNKIDIDAAGIDLDIQPNEHKDYRITFNNCSIKAERFSMKYWVKQVDFNNCDLEFAKYTSCQGGKQNYKGSKIKIGSYKIIDNKTILKDFTEFMFKPLASDMTYSRKWVMKSESFMNTFNIGPNWKILEPYIKQNVDVLKLIFPGASSVDKNIEWRLWAYITEEGAKKTTKLDFGTVLPGAINFRSYTRNLEDKNGVKFKLRYTA